MTQNTYFEGEAIGPKMHSALVHVATEGPYQSKNALATAVGPHGSSDYGYRIVNRCVSKDLLELDADHSAASPHGRGALLLTDKGRRYLDEHSLLVDVETLDVKVCR